MTSSFNPASTPAAAILDSKVVQVPPNFRALTPNTAGVSDDVASWEQEEQQHQPRCRVVSFGHVTNTHKGTTSVGTRPAWPAAVCGLTLHSLLQHGEAVGDLGLQLVDLERSADGEKRGEQLTVSFTV